MCTTRSQDVNVGPFITRIFIRINILTSHMCLTGCTTGKTAALHADLSALKKSEYSKLIRYLHVITFNLSEKYLTSIEHNDHTNIPKMPHPNGAIAFRAAKS